MAENKENLKREIGVFGLSANLINFIVGAGIFTLPAIVAAKLDSASILAYLVCGLLITLIMLCFAEVGTKITTSGGPYTYIRHSFGPYFGFISAILFLLGNISADAAVANAMVDILGSSLTTFKENPLGEVSNYVFGPIGYTLVSIGGIVVMLGVIISSILSTPRVLFRIAKDNLLPFKFLANIHNKYATPYFSIIVYAGLAFFYASIGGFEQLAIIASAYFLLIYLGISLSGRKVIDSLQHLKLFHVYLHE